MDEPKESPDWSEVVDQAAEHVHKRRAAIQEAAEQQRPRSHGPTLAAVCVVLLGVLAWDVYVISRPPDLPSPAVEAENLRYFVVEAVDVIEDFRADQGRLPTRADLGDLLDEDILYQTRGTGYVVSAEGEGASVEYDSGMPLAEWIATGGGS
jgi:hypothetical protein